MAGQLENDAVGIATTTTAQDSSNGDQARIPIERPIPAADGPCSWDCQAVPDGNVGINDFLDLLGNWGRIGTPCDFGDGPAGVGIEDFLDLLAHWGPCP